MPHFAITVGLQRTAPDGTSEIVAGVTYNPVMNELFWAEKGKGCYLNDTRIRVAARRDLSESLIATGLPFIGKTGHAQAIKDLHAIGQRVAGIRRLGSAALDFAWVAAGRYDAFYERNLQPWDIAAGIVLLREAGGFVSDMDGGQDMLEKGSLCAAVGESSERTEAGSGAAARGSLCSPPFPIQLHVHHVCRRHPLG
jgi:myo-inositol-1(or 4)-monophosphatase